MNRRAFFRTVAAAAVVAPVVPIPAPAVAPGRLRLSALVSRSFIDAQRRLNFYRAMEAEVMSLRPRQPWMRSRRLTLADIRGCGSPERLPA